jgi:type I restriction enzyme S subunit
VIEGLKPYPSYKESGVPWLGTVPSHWRVARNKSVARLGTGHTPSRSVPEYWENCTIPWFTLADVHQIRDDRRKFVYETREKISELGLANSAAQRLPPGTVILSRTASVGFSAILGREMATSQDFVTWTPGPSITSEFLLAAMRAMRTDFARLMHGSVHNTIYMPMVQSFRVPLPPLEEQNTIVRFLDYAERRIRRYLAARRRSIALLEEQKLALVDRAVSQGLDPGVRLTASGVPWLGMVPKHWVVTSLRFRYDQCLGKMVDAKQATGKHLIPYLRNVDVRWGRINTANLPLIDIAPHERERFTVRPGDLLACEGRHLGRCAFWSGEIEVCGFQKALHRLRALDRSIDEPRFLFYCMRLANARDAFNMNKQDTGIPHLTGEMLRAHRFPFPPINEQRAIVAHLDTELARLDHGSESLRREISLLEEYRTRLVSDVVTGTVDVREAASRLPLEVEDTSWTEVIDADVASDEELIDEETAA